MSTGPSASDSQSLSLTFQRWHKHIVLTVPPGPFRSTQTRGFNTNVPLTPFAMYKVCCQPKVPCLLSACMNPQWAKWLIFNRWEISPDCASLGPSLSICSVAYKFILSEHLRTSLWLRVNKTAWEVPLKRTVISLEMICSIIYCNFKFSIVCLELQCGNV